MRDQMQELFRVALGLSELWIVSRIEFSAEQHQLDLWVDFPSGSRFACPECGRAGRRAYDSTERTWRRLNFFEHKTFLHARQPRIACPEHKSVFQDAFAFDDLADAEPLLKQWHFWATHSRIAPMIKAAKTIKAHWAGVLRWFTSRISNGAVEAINGLIQSAERKARGFRSSAYLMTMIYLIAGKLDFKLPALAPATQRK